MNILTRKGYTVFAVVVLQSLSLFMWPHKQQHARIHVLHYLLGFVQTRVQWVHGAIQPSHLLSAPSPPVLNLSQHQCLFQWVCSSYQYWSFSFNINPVTEYSELISFRIDWFDLLGDSLRGSQESSPHHSWALNGEKSMSSLLLRQLCSHENQLLDGSENQAEYYMFKVTETEGN